MSHSAHPAGPSHGHPLPGGEPVVAPPDLTVLNRRIWSANVDRAADGELTVAGLPAGQLAAEHGTPVFVLDSADLRQRARDYVAAFAGGDVFYAGKAFLCTAVARLLAEEGLGIDVCTAGELAIALRAGVDPQRLALHGNNKSVDELRQALAAGAGRIVLDSHLEIERLAELAARLGVRPRVLVRVTVGVEAHTHAFIATAHEDQKFGFSLASGQAAAAVARVLDHPELQLVGLHSHIGSQIFDTGGFEVAAHRVVGLLARIRDSHGIELPEIDLGGGQGIAYVDGDDPQPPARVAARLREIVERECGLAGLAVPRLAVEPGRAIIGPSMLTLYEVGTVKPVELDGGLVRHYVSVDGGMSDNIRTALYDAGYTVVLANRTSEAPPQLSRVVGKHCESGDIVVRDCWLPADVAPGDLLAVAATGAYCYAMASNYNRIPRPPVVAVVDGESEVLLRRETLEQLMANDVGWAVAPAGPEPAPVPGRAG
ncbi:diaminopimelate decarboxylase [Jatrophihabitans sp.]|uniref:diaminopimelate decarboxylase n=1 Tax=Jatrophihabitans sp. TaxID=1932789 RepID=UPI002B75041D|nr:diaminopimelate decarboxylase [Jatrophihabitans sp.]